MAIRATTEGVGQWNNKMPFPKDRYTLRVTEEVMKISGNDNPQIARTLEIVAPEIGEIDGKKISVVGCKIYQYLPSKVSDGNGGWDQEKSDKAYGKLRDDLLMFDPSLTEIDDENPPCIAKGRYVDAIIVGRSDKSYKPPTKEQIAKGMKVGDPIKDAQGNDVEVYKLAIEGSILAVVEAPAGVAF